MLTNLELGISEDEEVISRMRKRVLNAKKALWGERDTLQQIEEEENPGRKDERKAAAPQARREEPRTRKPRRVGDGAKRRTVEVSEEDALSLLTKEAQQVSIVGYQVTKSPLGKVRRMMETLSNGKGKIFTTEYTDGCLWIVGEEGAVAEISRKLEARGATKARESELGRLRMALKKGMENDKTPPRKKELLASLVAEGGIESAILEKWKAKRTDTLQRVDAL